MYSIHSGVAVLLQLSMNFSVFAVILLLFLISLSEQLRTRELEDVGVEVKKKWFIQPGHRCSLRKEIKASEDFRNLKNKTITDRVVKEIVKEICFGGEEPGEPDINPIRCTNGICDCWHKAYTWDLEARTCRTGLNQPCHTSGGLKCLTNTTCLKNHRCVCDDGKACDSEKVTALASITIPPSYRFQLWIVLFISIFWEEH